MTVQGCDGPSPAPEQNPIAKRSSFVDYVFVLHSR